MCLAVLSGFDGQRIRTQRIHTNMSPNPKPLFGSEGRNGAGQRNERLVRFAVAALVVYGLLQIRVGRWKSGIVQIGLPLLLFYRWRQDRIKRQSAPTVHHRSERRSRSPERPVSASEVGKRCAWCGGVVAAASILALGAEGRYGFVIMWFCFAVIFIALAEMQFARNPPKSNSERTFSKRDLMRNVAVYLVFMVVLAFVQTETQTLGGEPWGLVVPAVVVPAVAWIIFKRYLAWCDLADLAQFTTGVDGDQEEDGS